MDSLKLLTLSCCLLSVSIKVTHGWSIYTSRLVEVKEPSVIDLLKYVEQEIDYKYSDTQKSLTAIKSQKFKACFINDLDPFWNPSDDDLQVLSFEKPGLDFKDDFKHLQDLAGDVITHMCSDLQVYWFAGADLQPSPAGKPSFRESVEPPLLIDNVPKELLPIPLEIINPNGNGMIQTGPQNTVPGTNSKWDDLGQMPGGPPPLDPFKGDLFAPPIGNTGTGGLVEPPMVPGGDNIIEPPVINPGNGLVEPPVINNGGQALIEPPLANPGTVDLLEPPMISDGNVGDLIEPPMLNPGNMDNTGLIEPPLKPKNGFALLDPTDQGSDGDHGFDSSLAGFQSYRRMGFVKTPPPLSQLLELLKNSEIKMETMAPPTPDFRTPAFRRIY